MHATADTWDVINSKGAGRRVMRGVRHLSNIRSNFKEGTFDV
jgi:hypothetical protein